MKSKKKLFPRIVSGILVVVMVLGLLAGVVTTAHATELETGSTETTEQVETTPAVEETEPQEEVIITDMQTKENYKEGDYQLGVTAHCPEGFSSTVIVLMQDDSTGQKYKLFLEAMNNYFGDIYLPNNGHYTILEVSIPSASAFTFIMDTTGFTTSEGGHEELFFTMKDKDKIVQNETGQFEFAEDYVEETEDEMTSNLYQTQLSGVKMDREHNLHYDVTYTGSSKVSLDVYGFSAQAYDAVVKIIKGGIIGEAQYQLSLDGGKTYYQNIFTTSSSAVIPGIDLTFRFYTGLDTNELIEGDLYSFKTQVTFYATSNTTPNKGLMVVTGSPKHSVNYNITVMSSGGPGISKISVVEDEEGAVAQIYQIPENGIVDLEDNVKLLFNTGLEYNKGQLYTVEIYLGEVIATNYTPLYIFIGIFGVGIIIGCIVLFSKKEKRIDYVIRPYKSRQDEGAYDKK